MTELKVDATLENLERVLSFVEERLETCSCSMKTIMQIQIAVEEIYVNIASYAYKEKKGEAIIKIETDQEVPQVSLTFEDYGDPYNPLLKEDPDITLSAEYRRRACLFLDDAAHCVERINAERKNENRKWRNQ